jgi:hypothetical protein
MLAPMETLPGPGNLMTWRRRAFGTAALALLVGCAVQPGLSPPPGADARPPIPRGWVTLTTPDGDLSLVVPPEIEAIHAADGDLMAQAPMEDGVIPFEIIAVGPGRIHPPRPSAGMTVAAYLQATGYLPAPDAAVTYGDTSERSVSLPTGTAIEFRTTPQPGLVDEGRVVIYLFEAPKGVAMLRFVGSPEGMDRRAAEIDLISRLAMFAPTGGSHDPPSPEN